MSRALLGAATEPPKVSCNACRVAVFTSPEGEVGSHQEEIRMSASWVLTSALMLTSCVTTASSLLWASVSDENRAISTHLSPLPGLLCCWLSSVPATSHVPQSPTPSYLAFLVLACKLHVPTSEHLYMLFLLPGILLLSPHLPKSSSSGSLGVSSGRPSLTTHAP